MAMLVADDGTVYIEEVLALCQTEPADSDGRYVHVSNWHSRNSVWQLGFFSGVVSRTWLAFVFQLMWCLHTFVLMRDTLRCAYAYIG
jgi:hypothetical protein